MSRKIEELSEVLVSKILEGQMEYELVDVEYVKENGEMYLRILIDKEGTMALEDCEKLSRSIGKKLDEEDFIADSYYLEVSSPGLDRTLKKEKDFKREAGKLVLVKLFKSGEYGKEFVAKLLGIDEGQNVLLEVEETRVQIPKKEIAKINLYVEI